MITGIIWLLVIVIGVFFLIRKFLESLVIDKIHEKAVLITGCDSGFGHHLALKCLINNMKVFAACLTKEVIYLKFYFYFFQGIELLELEAKNISEKYSKNFSNTKLKTFLLDVSNQDSVDKAKIFVEQQLEPGQGFIKLSKHLY